MFPGIFNRPAIASSEQQVLKAFSYNVLWSNFDYDRAIALINQEQPDIAIFQEAVPHWHQGLKPLGSTYPYHVRGKKIRNGGL